MKKSFCLAVVLMVWSQALLSDANNGELGGYRMGDRYPLTSKNEIIDKWEGILYIRARNPIIPNDMQSVVLITSTKTYTIGSIKIQRQFKNDKEADEFRRRYEGILRAKYPDWELKHYSSASMTLLKPPYRLQSQMAAPTGAGDGKYGWKHIFEIKLSYDDTSAAQNSWKALLDKEFVQQSDTKGL